MLALNEAFLHSEEGPSVVVVRDCCVCAPAGSRSAYLSCLCVPSGPKKEWRTHLCAAAPRTLYAAAHDYYYYYCNYCCYYCTFSINRSSQRDDHPTREKEKKEERNKAISKHHLHVLCVCVCVCACARNRLAVIKKKCEQGTNAPDADCVLCNTFETRGLPVYD